MENKGPLGKGDDRALALAALFSVAAKDIQEISELLQQVYQGTTIKGRSVLGKRKRRQKIAKTAYWTNKELDFIEEVLYKHITDGGTPETVNVEGLAAGLPGRSKTEVEKQVKLYQRATADNFKDLSFFKQKQGSKSKGKAVKEPTDDMEVSPKPTKKKRKSNPGKAQAASQKVTVKRKKKRSSGAVSASQ